MDGGRQKFGIRGGVLLEPWIIRESRTHQHNIPPVRATARAQRKSHTRGHHERLVMGKSKMLMKRGKVAKKKVNKISGINLINNTTIIPQITVNGDRIVNRGSTLHCYSRDTTNRK